MKKKYIYLILLLIILIFYTFKKNNNCFQSNYDVPLEQDISRNTLIYRKSFEENKIVLIDNIFQDSYFQELKDSIIEYSKTNYISNNDNFTAFRKAKTVKASEINKIDIIKNLYYSSKFINFLKSITNINMENVNCDDESSMNLLIYNRPNDFISWHYDPNHYSGNRLTILISIVNENEISGELSSSEIQYKINNNIYSIKMKPNSILIFNGSMLEHRATGISNNETRIQLSLTYCDICRETLIGNIKKKIKEKMLGY